MIRRLCFSLICLLLLLAGALWIHLLPQMTIHEDQSHASLRIATFGICILLMTLSRPKWVSGRISLLVFVVLFAELVMYFRPVPIDPSGIGEAVDWFLPFWLYVNLLNIFVIPIAVILLICSYLQREKTSYIIFAAIYLILLAFLFPFEQIWRWGTYALM